MQSICTPIFRPICKSIIRAFGSDGYDFYNAIINESTNQLASYVTVTRAGTASYFDSAGALQAASANTARYDYNPDTLAYRGLLIEDSRTNLLLNSTTLGTQSVTVTAVAHTLSFYGTGTVTLTGVSTAGPLVGTGANQRVSLLFTPTAGSLTLTVTGSVKWANLEVGAKATSFIPTTAAAVTRNADLIDVATLSDIGWNPVEGSFYAETLKDSAAAGFEWICSASDTSGGNRIEMLLAATNDIYMSVAAGGSTEVGTIGATTWAANTKFKSIVSYKANDCSVCLNGGAVVTDSLVTIPTVNHLYIGSRYDGAGNGLNGWIQKLRYYPVNKTDAEQQALTT